MNEIINFMSVFIVIVKVTREEIQGHILLLQSHATLTSKKNAQLRSTNMLLFRALLVHQIITKPMSVIPICGNNQTCNLLAYIIRDIHIFCKS